MRRRYFWLPNPFYGKASIVSTDKSSEKDIELKIAKKQYEIEVLRIQLRYPDKKPEAPRKIWFSGE